MARDLWGRDVQVHICLTHTELRAHADLAQRALGGAGDEVSIADTPADRLEEVGRVGQADALVCLLSGVNALRADGTVPGEWEVAAATEHRIPVLAYRLTGSSERSDGDGQRSGGHGHGGYVRARLTHFRERLRRDATVDSYQSPQDLRGRLLRDLDHVRTSLQRMAPGPVRELHGRLRRHPRARFDATALSMHNMDVLYRVSQIQQNSETPSEFLSREPGGAGANTMVALSRLGLSTAVVGAIGDDPAGIDLRTSLEDDDVDASLLITVTGTESGRGVVIRDRDHNYMNLISGGANDQLARVLQLPDLLEAMGHSRIVHYSSFSGAAERVLLESVQLPAEAVLTFKPSTLHARSGADRLESLVGRCEVLFVSLEELRMLLDMTSIELGQRGMIDYLRALYRWRSRRGYESPVIVVVYGVQAEDADDRITVAWGAHDYEGAVQSERSFWSRATPPVDTTGTRDAALAGVLFGLLRGRTPVDCANLAYVLAMSAASEIGSRAGLPRSTRVRDRWRELMEESEPPQWLDPYGYAPVGSSAY